MSLRGSSFVAIVCWFLAALAPPPGNAVKDSGVVKIGVSLKWMIMKKARLPHVVCGLKTAQPRRESGDVTEDKRGGQRQ